MLLQVLDEGVLTDSQGRHVDFRQTIIILTSNLGAEALSALPEGALTNAAKEGGMAAVRARFRPEFLNRLDEILLFERLGRAEMDTITLRQLGLLGKRLTAQGITLDVDKTAHDWLAQKGYAPGFGARPLKRVLQRSLQNPLAEHLISGDIKQGDKIVVRAQKDGLVVGGKKYTADDVLPAACSVAKHSTSALH